MQTFSGIFSKNVFCDVWNVTRLVVMKHGKLCKTFLSEKKLNFCGKYAENGNVLQITRLRTDPF